MVWQHLHSPPSRILAAAGAGRGLASRPTKHAAGRGQMLVDMLVDKGGSKGRGLAAKLKGDGGDRGQSVPSSPMGKPEQRGQADTHAKASLPSPITMHLDDQGPAVTYSEATSRPPLRAVASSSNLPVFNV